MSMPRGLKVRPIVLPRSLYSQPPGELSGGALPELGKGGFAVCMFDYFFLSFIAFALTLFVLATATLLVLEILSSSAAVQLLSEAPIDLS
jgi:hypothetical protein